MIIVLIVEDEESIRRTLRANLVAKDFQVIEASTASAALTAITDQKPHLILLDLGLPDLNGQDVLLQVRSWSKVPIVVLTATDDEKTKVAILDAGADDYITKPFSTAELIARINVALRHRREDVDNSPLFDSGHLHVNLQSKLVKLDNVQVHLTSTEYQLLAALVKNRGQVVSFDNLLRSVWGPEAVKFPHYLRVYIGLLRKKLEPDPSAPQHILTEAGIGYKIV